jgi:molybdopterin/thiamine biosynthesis adenylyltransferase
VDVISAGAITNAALFALSRWTDIQGQLRVIDKDFGEESNLNRYAMLRRRDLGTAKAQVLARSSTGALTIEPVEERYTEEALLTIGDLASRVLVGVDHIPSRWLAARHAPGWICVAGTTHFEVVVSEHGPQGPCAGCLHPRDDPGNADIPTVSFVSQLAGYLQAYRLIGNALGVARSSPTLAAPFNLGAPRAMMSIGIAPRPDCPVGCPASQAFHPRPAARDSVGDLSS